MNTKFSIQLYSELFKNNYSFYDYRVLHGSDIVNNQGAPSLDDSFFEGVDQYPPLYFLSGEIASEATYLDPNDAPYWFAQYINLNINCILKWEYKNSSNFYLVWTYQKGVNGENLNSIIDLLNYDKQENHNEIYNNQSIHLKIDYWFNI